MKVQSLVSPKLRRCNNDVMPHTYTSAYCIPYLIKARVAVSLLYYQWPTRRHATPHDPWGERRREKEEEGGGRRRRKEKEERENEHSCC